MLRYALRVPSMLLLFLLVSVTTTQAQECPSLSHEHYRTYEPNRSDRYYCVSIVVPADSLAVVTLARRDGRGEVDISVGTGLRRAGNGSYYVSDELAEADSEDSVPNVAFTDPHSDRRTLTVLLTRTNMRPGVWRIYYHYVNLPDEIGAAIAEGTAWYGGMALLREIFGTGDEEEDAERSRNVERGLNFGLSVLQRTNAAAVGVDVLLNEINGSIAEAFGGTSWVYYVLSAFFENIIQEIYKYALAEI